MANEERKLVVALVNALKQVMEDQEPLAKWNSIGRMM